MAMHLEEILASTRLEVERRKHTTDRRDLEHRAARHAPRGFAAALRERSQAAPAIIAEIKKASPSRGLIRPDFPVSRLAVGLAQGGAAALSVLTDEPFFQGSLAYLEQASAAAHIPCLRKDFMVDEFQLLEARAHSADAVLLIAAALDDATLDRLARAAQALGLGVLCEVHDAEEARRVADLGVDAVGVNNRDLKTFDVRLETSLELANLLPKNAVRVAESGIHTAADIERLRAAGFDAFLIGESLMRQPDPGESLAALLAGVAAPNETPTWAG